MLIAAAIKSCHAVTAEEALSAISRCGLHGVEVDGRTLATTAKLRDLLDQHALKALTLDITDIDPSSDAWFEATPLALESASTLGANIVIVNAGDDRESNARRHRLYLRLRRLADLAAERGLTLAFDTLPGLCDDARAMLRTIEDLQHPAVRLNFDTGRYLQQNPWSSGEVGLQRVFGHLASIRLTNFTVGVEPTEFPPLGQGGDVDCSRTLQILRGLEFGGPCTIAFQPATRDPPTAQQCAEWLRQSAAHLRGCGWFD
jgi:L-ribulose-5-phosphate 3-epimerase